MPNFQIEHKFALIWETVRDRAKKDENLGLTCNVICKMTTFYSYEIYRYGYVVDV